MITPTIVSQVNTSMNQKRKKTLTIDKNLLAALLVNLAVMVFFAVFVYPVFETNDDSTIRFFVDETKVITDTHLIYQNVILGYIYRLLYTLTRRFPWYSIFMWAVIFASLTAVGYVLFARMKKWTALVFSLFISLWFGYEGYCLMQYTKVAGLAGGAGMLLLYHACDPERLSEEEGGINRLEVAVGLLLGSIGSLYRFPMFLAAAMLTSGIPVSMLLGELCVQGKKALVRIRPLFCTCAGMLLLSLLSWGADRLTYRSPFWQDYLRFNKVRTELLDYGLPVFETYQKQYESIGLDENAYEVLKYWNFADPEVITTEKLEIIASWKEKDPSSFGELLLRFFTEVPAGMKGRRVLYCLLALCLLWILCGRRRWQQIAGILWSLLGFFAFYLYLVGRGRYLYNRVDVVLLFALSLVFVWMIRSCHASLALGCFVMFLGLMEIMVGAPAMPAFQGSQAAAQLEEKKTMQQNRLMEAAGDNDHLYLFTFQTLSDDDSFGPFEMATPGSMANLMWLGGWGAYTRIYQATEELWGISNPYRDMVDNEKVYLVDIAVGDRLNFLKSYYGVEAEAIKVGNLGQYPVYSIRSIS